MTLTLAGAAWVLWLRDRHSLLVQACGAAFVLWSLASLGGLLDGRAGARRLEIARVVVLAEARPNDHPHAAHLQRGESRLRKRLSGKAWEKSGKRLYFLHRWPSQRAMKRVRRRVKEMTGTHRNGVKDVRVLTDDLNAVLRGWGNYFCTGNAAEKFVEVATQTLPREASRSQLARRSSKSLDERFLRRGPWPVSPAWNHPLSGGRVMQRLERPPVSRVMVAGNPHARFDGGREPSFRRQTEER